MPQRNLFLSISLTMILFSACSKMTGGPSATRKPSPTESSPTTGRVSSVNFVRASAADLQIPAGGSADAIVRITIQRGYLINAKPATDPYLRATELSLQSGDGGSIRFI